MPRCTARNARIQANVNTSETFNVNKTIQHQLCLSVSRLSCHLPADLLPCKVPTTHLWWSGNGAQQPRVVRNGCTPVSCAGSISPSLAMRRLVAIWPSHAMRRLVVVRCQHARLRDCLSSRGVESCSWRRQELLRSAGATDCAAGEGAGQCQVAESEEWRGP
eukprot:2529481-Rhodomonas_salina.2